MTSRRRTVSFAGTTDVEKIQSFLKIDPDQPRPSLSGRPSHSGLEPPRSHQRWTSFRQRSASVAQSVFSIGVARSLGEAGVLDMSLADLCDYIKQHRSISKGSVLSCGSYYEPLVGTFIVHRFLILHLSRSRNPDIWLRLDRRTGVQGMQFVDMMLGREISANDTVRVALEMSTLVHDRAICENLQIYGSPPLLGNFRSILLAVVEVLDTYQLYDKNCWLFSSALQEFLGVIGLGRYFKGQPQNYDLSRDIRRTIWDCALLKYSGTFPVPAGSESIGASGILRPLPPGGVINVVQQQADGSWLVSDFENHHNPANLGRFLVDPTNLKVIPRPRRWRGREGNWYAQARNDSPSLWSDHPLIVHYKRGDILIISQTLQGTRWWIGMIA